MEEIIKRIDPRSDSYSALMWDVLTNAHRYTPRPGDRVMDLGAHYGVFSLFCAARGCEVHAYEPQKIPFRELQHSAEVADEIGYGAIYANNLAVWSHDAEIELLLPLGLNPSTATASAARTHGVRSEAVNAISLDRALNFAPVWHCLKIDIEGAEWEVLRSSKRLGCVMFLTIEIHNDILGPEQCEEIRLILEKEFRHITRLPNKNKPSETVAYFCRR